MTFSVCFVPVYKKRATDIKSDVTHFVQCARAKINQWVQERMMLVGYNCPYSGLCTDGLSDELEHARKFVQTDYPSVV